MLSTSPFVLPRKTPFGLGEHLAEWATGLKRLNQFYAQRPASGDTQAFCALPWMFLVSIIK